MVNCGDTFLAGDDNSGKLHLWIVITPPKEGEVVTVCLVTATKFSDRMVVLNKGDHPFIERESVIAYRYSELRTVPDIEAAIVAEAAVKREPVSEVILKRLQDGLLESDFTPNGVRSYFQAVMSK